MQDLYIPFPIVRVKSDNPTILPYVYKIIDIIWTIRCHSVHFDLRKRMWLSSRRPKSSPPDNNPIPPFNL